MRRDMGAVQWLSVGVLVVTVVAGLLPDPPWRGKRYELPPSM
jgi:hypothetical protein